MSKQERLLSSSTWIISSGVVAVAYLVLQTSLPWAFNFSSLKPLFIINGIIFALAASARIHRSRDEDHHDQVVQPISTEPEFSFPDHSSHDLTSFDFNISGFGVSAIQGGSREYFSAPLPKPPVSMRSGVGSTSQATNIAATQASRKADKDGENQSMEDTWKKIMEERSSSSSLPWRHLATWQSHRPDQSSSGSNGPKTSHVVMKKSETFQERKSFQPLIVERRATWLRMKKEAPMGREELNRRVEAFIKKFNDEIRLQRLESLKRYNFLGHSLKR